MRVLQVNLEDGGGAFSLVYQMQRILKNEIIFDYYSMGSFKRRNIMDSIYDMKGVIKEANLRQNRFIGHLLLPCYFYRFLKENNYEIVHIHSDSAWKLLVYAIPAKMAGVRRIIVHSHSSNVNGDYLRIKLLFHIIAKSILPKCADIYYACSDKAALWMFPRALQSRVLFIKNGIDVGQYAFNKGIRNEKRKRLNIQDDEFVIGTIGDFSYQKNPEYMIEIFEKLFERDKRTKLLFVGEGERRSIIHTLIKGKESERAIIFYGYTDKVNEVLNVLDCFILTSRSEGLPVSAVEAQANGLPCILADTISRQCKLTNNCCFLHLDIGIDIWVDTIMAYKDKKTDRYMGSREVKKQGFDIKKTADIMRKMYTQQEDMQNVNTE